MDSHVGPEGKAVAWWLNGDSGKLEPVSDFTCPAIKSLVGSGDGGLIALVTHDSKYSMEDELIAFDKEAKPLWRVKQDYGDDHALFSPEDIAVTSKGQIAVLDNIQQRIQFFDRKGKYIYTISLEKAWGRKPNYPTGISAEKDGGILIHDFQGVPPVVRMNGDGKPLAQFQLKNKDGRIIDPTYGVKVSPSGRIWVCDGSSMVRVTDKGVADLTLGPMPDNSILGRIATAAVDQRGHLFAVDDRTGAVHVFDQSGSRLRICSPLVSDFSKQLFRANLGVAESGEVFLSSGDDFPNAARYVHFASDGTRLGIKQFKLDDIQEEWYPLPRNGRTLALGYHDAFIISNGGDILRKIQRRPDGNWLEHPERASIGPDGSFAIVSGRSMRHDGQWFVNLYSPAGEPIRTVAMPSTCMNFCLAFTGKYLASCTESEICLFSSSGGPVSAFQYPLEHLQDHWWSCFSTQGGHELWLVSTKLKKVYRFELP